MDTPYMETFFYGVDIFLILINWLGGVIKLFNL